MSSANPAPFQASRLHEKLSAILTISQQMNSERDLGTLLDHEDVSAHIVAGARGKGLLRLEGREYVAQDGDCMEIRFNRT